MNKLFLLLAILTVCFTTQSFDLTPELPTNSGPFWDDVEGCGGVQWRWIREEGDWVKLYKYSGTSMTTSWIVASQYCE